MVNEGIVLGHKISEGGIEIDKAKVDAIEKMPCPKDIKGIRSFLGHAGFYRRFIKDFSKISRPLSNLLQKDVPFVSDDDYVEAFETLKKVLILHLLFNHLIGTCLLKLCVMLVILVEGPCVATGISVFLLVAYINIMHVKFMHV